MDIYHWHKTVVKTMYTGQESENWIKKQDMTTCVLMVCTRYISTVIGKNEKSSLSISPTLLQLNAEFETELIINWS